MAPRASSTLKACELFRHQSYAGRWARPPAVLDEPPALGERFVEHAAVQLRVGELEGVARELELLLVAHVAVQRVVRPAQLVDVVDVLQVHRDALEAVRDLARDRREVDAARLLEVGELRDLLAVEQHLPADAPRPERRRLPVVLLEAHVVHRGVDADRLERGQVLVLDVRRGRLQDHLELLVLVEAVRVLAVAAVGGTARGLHVADPPGPRPEHAEEGLGVHRARAHLGVPRLVDEAAPLRPEPLQREDDLLQRHRAISRAISRMTRGERRSRSRCAEMRSR